MKSPTVKIASPIMNSSIIACALSVGIYIYVLLKFLSDYAAMEWPQYGYSYDGLSLFEAILLLLFTIITSACVPKYINSPSSLSIIILYLFVVIPAAACSVVMNPTGMSNYAAILILITLCFSITCIFFSKNYNYIYKKREVPPFFTYFLATFSFILMILLIYRFGSIMSFSDLDELYDQRAAGAATNLLEGYAQTYLQYVFSTGLLAIGLYYRNVLTIITAILGSMISFMITAEKAGIMYPIFITALYYILSSRVNFFRSINFIILVFSTTIFFSTILFPISSIADFIAWYFGMRTILFPGTFILYYSDFFSSVSFTYFSHLRGFALIVPAPGEFVSDPRWPSLGLIVGEELIKIKNMNANANFIASDGVASMGYIGIVISFALYGGFLRLVDAVCRDIDLRLSLCILLSLFLTLTNGSLLTALTSFGGIFWVVIFKYIFVSDSNGSRRLIATHS